MTVNSTFLGNILKELTVLSKSTLVVGVLNREDDKKELPIATKAAFYEFGSPALKIPQTAFMRSTLIRNNKKYKKLLDVLLSRIIQGKSTAKKELSLIGEIIVGDIKQEASKIRDKKLLDSIYFEVVIA